MASISEDRHTSRAHKYAIHLSLFFSQFLACSSFLAAQDFPRGVYIESYSSRYDTTAMRNTKANGFFYILSPFASREVLKAVLLSDQPKRDKM